MEKQVTWLPVCSRCDRAKVPRGSVPADGSEVDDYCTWQCTGYEEHPHPMWPPSSTEDSPPRGRALPRDADREAPCCSEEGPCVERDWRSEEVPAKEPTHITEQLWMPEHREDGVYLVGEDGSVIVKLCRSDHGSDLMIAGYIMGLQSKQVPRKEPP